MKKEFLNLKNIHYEINSQTILNNINLFIDKGEFISIIGDSGSGKTTLLKIISGLKVKILNMLYKMVLLLQELV